MTSKSILPNNGIALCIIIIVVVGLFIHYELGYNFELFKLETNFNLQLFNSFIEVANTLAIFPKPIIPQLIISKIY